MCCHIVNPSGAVGGSKVLHPVSSKEVSASSVSETSLLDVSVQASLISVSQFSGMTSGKALEGSTLADV